MNERDVQLGHYRVYDLDTLKADLTQEGFDLRHWVFCKCLSNRQIEELFDARQIEGFYRLDEKFPDHAAIIFVVATSNSPIWTPSKRWYERGV